MFWDFDDMGFGLLGERFMGSFLVLEIGFDQ